MAARLVFAGSWSEKLHHFTFVCMNNLTKVVQCNYIFKKTVLYGYTVKSVFSGFIPTMPFVIKQHNFTLKALILFVLFKWSLKRYKCPENFWQNPCRNENDMEV